VKSCGPMNEQGSLSASVAPKAVAPHNILSHEPQPVTRVDALTGNIVIINANRQKRPNLPSTGCPFCPGGVEAPEPYDTRWFKNRWPQLPDGKAEVLLYSPIHDASFASLGVDGVRKVIEMWNDRFLELGSRSDVAYVLEFENRGAEVGATIAHPHGQIYAFDTVPPFPAHELNQATCAICEELGTEGPSGELNVASHHDWVAWVPSAAIWPYELRIAPRGHVGDIPEARATWDGFAEVLVDALSRLDRLFDAPMPYMLWIHQKPTDGGEWPMAHMHVHVTPLLRAPGVQRFVASAEQGAGVYLNPVPPEIAAENLRNA
jgi:UDPglucose--hexose-1-phosphate uridylyltransferase